MNDLTILHLSDLHIDGQAAYPEILKNLLVHIKEEIAPTREKTLVVAVTGDIIDKGNKAAIDNAKKFFEDLKKTLGNKVAGIVLVPGNHDIFRSNSCKFIIPACRTFAVQKEYALQVKPPKYELLILVELHKIERFSSQYEQELKCLSRCIRRYIWKEENEDNLWCYLKIINIVFEESEKAAAIDDFWGLGRIITYTKCLCACCGELKTDKREVLNKIIDSIQIANAKVALEERWKNIRSSPDGDKAFIDIFQDIFENAITKYETDFICSLDETDILYRMVKEKICDEGRFIPWPNKVQNRWNPPGKTYLYLSYGKEDVAYNESLKLGQYVCLLECRVQGEEDVCFCRFVPTQGGRILNLAYNDVELYEMRDELDDLVKKRTGKLANMLRKDVDLIKHRHDEKYVYEKIRDIVEANQIDKAVIEKNSARQLLKLICSSIYTKVDENDALGKEKAYKSFQDLAQFLENQNITGIIYPCTRTNKIHGKNIVLFNAKDAEPIKGSIMQYHATGKE